MIAGYEPQNLTGQLGVLTRVWQVLAQVDLDEPRSTATAGLALDP